MSTTPSKLKLTLPEELVLLALEESGSCPVHIFLGLLAGGVLGELTLAGRIGLDEPTLAGRLSLDRRKVAVLASALTGDPALDDSLAMIVAHKRGRSVKRWLRELWSNVHTNSTYIPRLIDRGLVREERVRVRLRLGKETRYPAVDTSARNEILGRVHGVLLGGCAPDARTAALISIGFATNLADAAFGNGEREQARHQAETVSHAAMTPAQSDMVMAVRLAVGSAYGDNRNASRGSVC